MTRYARLAKGLYRGDNPRGYPMKIEKTIENVGYRITCKGVWVGEQKLYRNARKVADAYCPQSNPTPTVQSIAQGAPSDATGPWITPHPLHHPEVSGVSRSAPQIERKSLYMPSMALIQNMFHIQQIDTTNGQVVAECRLSNVTLARERVGQYSRHPRAKKYRIAVMLETVTDVSVLFT